MSRQMTPHFHKSKTLDNKYMSPSVAGKPSMGRHSSRRSVSSERDRSPPPRRRERSLVARSRHSRSPPKRERSPTQRKSSYKDKDGSPHKERHSDRVKSPKRESRSLSSRSVSPRSKRLKRVQAETEVDRASERDHGKRDEKPKHERSYKDRDSEKEAPKERRERRSELESKSDRDRTQGREMEKDRDKDAGGYRASSKSKHRRSESPSERHHHRSRRHSRSPPPASRSRAHDEDNESRGTRGAEHRDDENDALAQMKAAEEALETKEKQKPSFELSGKLAEETNRVRGVTLLFTEPPDARKPDIRWRLYVFKGGEVLNEPLYVHRQSCYLFGRERRVADIPTDHPSCSKQHAVLQYRQVEVEQPDGMMAKQTKPYLMDLGSTNKTFINEAPIEPQRYYELFEKDTIKFGNSSREYVLLHENSMT